MAKKLFVFVLQFGHQEAKLRVQMDYAAGTSESGACLTSLRHRVVSLFSGCGGMDLGFLGGFEFLGVEYGRLPFDIIWANEINPHACETYRANIGTHVVPGDIWENLHALPAHADVVIGGFPCQDVSINGKGAGVDGARTGLYRAMVECVARLQPKAFVAENVKGLLTKRHENDLRTIIRDFEQLGYRVQYALLRAQDYGVPQTRERVIIVGTRSEVTRYLVPSISHLPHECVTAREALLDLEEMPWDEETSHIWSLAAKSPEQGSRRLRADRPGYTIRAECHGNIQFHYRLDRRISMREAARLQSFPDVFRFKAKLRETERQIGNAVPPVLAWHVARSLATALVSSSKVPFREDAANAVAV